jgi:hypothetical protein
LPNVWPPAISATVSSSFIAIRREGLADVVRRGERIGVAVRPLRVDVDEAHLHRRERILELALAASSARRHRATSSRAPVDVLIRLPGVDATTAEAEGLEPHRLEGDIAGEDQEVGPRELAAVLLLDRPQQARALSRLTLSGQLFSGAKRCWPRRRRRDRR